MKKRVWYWLEPVIAGIISGLVTVGVVYLLRQETIWFISDPHAKTLGSLSLAFLLAAYWIIVHWKEYPLIIAKSLIYGGVGALTVFYFFPALARVF